VLADSQIVFLRMAALQCLVARGQWFPNFFKRDPNVSLNEHLTTQGLKHRKNVFLVLRKRKCFKLLYYYTAKRS